MAERDRRNMRTVPIPCSPDTWLHLTAAFPLTQAEWEQMIDVLVAMKPGLVAEPEPMGWIEHLAGPLLSKARRGYYLPVEDDG